MLLFEENATNIQVMGQLQYKSIAFQMYYRITLALARVSAKAMESSDNYMFPQQSCPTLKKTKRIIHLGCGRPHIVAINPYKFAFNLKKDIYFSFV